MNALAGRLRERVDAVALAVVALGLAARLLAARAPFLSPDEELHLRIASSPTFLETYRSSLFNAHPPLFVLLLHAWRRIAGSPWALRLLPVAFGTAFLWAAYRWTRALLGTAAGLSALALLAFLPSAVIVSAELRSYSAMLCFAAAALAALERALGTGSRNSIGAFAAFAGLALLSHYGAVFVVAAAVVYGTVRAAPPMRTAWLLAVGFLAGLSVFLYATHVSALRGGAMETEARSDWLRASYFRPGEEHPLAFLGRQTLALFAFLFSTPAGAAAALALFAAGLAILGRRRRPAALLLGVPFALAAAAGLLALYPFGGTRHSIALLPFAAAGVAAALARLTGERLWVPLLLAAALAPAGFAVGI